MLRIPLLIVSASLLSAGCAHQDEWRTVDTERQLVATAAIVFDGWSSRNIGPATFTYEGGFVASRLIGPYPSNEDFIVYLTTVAIADYFIARALPAKWRPYFQVGVFAMHTRAGLSNCKKELC